MARTEVVLETLVHLTFNRLTWLLAQGTFIEFNHHESFRL
jgi:hypothetical protein